MKKLSVLDLVKIVIVRVYKSEVLLTCRLMRSLRQTGTPVSRHFIFYRRLASLRIDNQNEKRGKT